MKCCDREMIHTFVQTMNTVETTEMDICPVCFSFEQSTTGQLDVEDALNCLGIDSEDIVGFGNISDEELTKEILRLMEEQDENNKRTIK